MKHNRDVTLIIIFFFAAIVLLVLIESIQDKPQRRTQTQRQTEQLQTGSCYDIHKAMRAGTITFQKKFPRAKVYRLVEWTVKRNNTHFFDVYYTEGTTKKKDTSLFTRHPVGQSSVKT